MKKVLYILNDCKRLYTYERLSGLFRAFRRMEEPVDLYIIRSDGHPDFASEHNHGEYNIYRLPDYRDFDGIILDISSVFTENSDTCASESVKYVIQAAGESGKPVISLGNEIKGFTCVGIDNYSSMRSVIAYLHGDKCLTDFWFVMGPPGNQENHERTRALMEYCEANNLPCGAERFFFESFFAQSGVRAFDRLYVRHGGTLPQAVICANDYLALGVSHAARAAGFVTGRDLLVSGFDNNPYAFLSPSIVTVDQCSWRMGEACADAMRRLWHGETLADRICIPTKLIVRENAEKSAREAEVDQQTWESVAHYSRDRDFSYHLNALQYQLPGCKSIEGIGNALVQCLSRLNCSELRLVLDSALLDDRQVPFADGGTDISFTIDNCLPMQGYSDSLELVFFWDADTGVQITRQKIGRSICALQSGGSGENYLYMPLHIMECTIGYLAVRNCMELIRIKSVSSVVSTLTMALRSYFTEKKLSHMNHLLSGISRKDELTGLYNRVGYHDLAYPLFREIRASGGRLGVLFMDMDRLKYINDTYGHVNGDLAIRSVANAILRCIPANAIPVRYGGDEFLVLVPNADEALIRKLLMSLYSALPEEAEALGVSDTLDVSAGFIIAESSSQKDLDQYVQEADDLMYGEKKAKACKVRRMIQEKS